MTGLSCCRLGRDRLRRREGRRFRLRPEHHLDRVALRRHRVGDRDAQVQHNARTALGLNHVDRAQIPLVDFHRAAAQVVHRQRQVDRDARRVGYREIGRSHPQWLLQLDRQEHPDTGLGRVDALDAVGCARFQREGVPAGCDQGRQQQNRLGGPEVSIARAPHRLLPCCGPVATVCSSSFAGRSTHSPAAS